VISEYLNVGLDENTSIEFYKVFFHYVQQNGGFKFAPVEIDVMMELIKSGYLVGNTQKLNEYIVNGLKEIESDQRKNDTTW
jgi:hypothetical protein